MKQYKKDWKPLGLLFKKRIGDDKISSVDDHVKTVKTNHSQVDAILHTYWESYHDGFASIEFMLFNKKTDDIRVEKSYTPRSKYYKEGKFDRKDVIHDYGAEFDDWVRRVNKRKYLRW